MVTQDPAADLFRNMQPEDKATLRANIIDLILGEDSGPSEEPLHVVCRSVLFTPTYPQYQMAATD